jgi:hypothetical protein
MWIYGFLDHKQWNNNQRTYIKIPTLGLGIPNTWGYLSWNKMQVNFEWVEWVGDIGDGHNG